MRPTWVLVVCSAMTRVLLISLLDSPWAIRADPGFPKLSAPARRALAERALAFRN